MGFFNNTQKKVSEDIYLKQVKPRLKRNGMTHIVMLNSFSKLLNQAFGCDDKYTTEIDYILMCMQKDGFQIIDVKFNSIQGQGLTGTREGFHTLITYR